MKKILTVICSVAMILGLVGVAGNANALEFTLSSYSVSLHESGLGLEVDSAPVLAFDSSFDLDLGESVTVGLFDIWTDESWINGDDLATDEISVGLGFSSPPPDFGGDVDGATGGFTGFFSGGYVAWDGPASISFGPIGDGILIASLSDEFFNVSLFGHTGCFGATVELTLTYDTAASAAASAPVPEPATILLMGTGLLGLVAYSRKRFSKKS